MIRKFLVLASVLLSVVSTRAHAAEMSHAWAGGVFGLSVPNYDGTTARGMYGLTAGAKLGDNLGLGVFFVTSQKTENAGRFNYDLYDVQLSYHFDGDAVGAWFGGRVGISKVDTGTTYSPMNFGLVAGYDHMLAEHFSLGGEVNWMSISQATPLNGFAALNFLAAAKLWF